MKEIKIFESVPTFNDKQIEKQLNKQVRFLKAIYPWLDEDNYQDGCIELRPIKRDKNLKYIRSYNTWRLEDKDINSLRDFLKLINGKGYCLYYSLFAFDYTKINGKEKGKINNDNALYTSILGVDFDNITWEEFQLEKKKLTDLGIESIDIFTGHGFQLIILLKEKVYDKEIIKKFTELLISKGFKADSSIIDCARVFRMPYSFNCKSLDPKNKHFGEGVVPTTDVNWTEKRYHLVDVFKNLNSLPTVIEESSPLTELDVKSIRTEPVTVEEKKVQLEKIKEIKNIKIENLNTLYGEIIDVERLPEPIQKMLQGSQSGLRNKVMLFIIPFLRNSLGLNIQTIKNILTIWGSLSTPSLNNEHIEKEVDRIAKYGFKGQQGKYTEELRKAYGYLEFNKYTRQNKILIPNSIFNDFDVISDGAVKIYLSMKLTEQIEGINEFTQKEIEDISQISRRTFFRNITDLISMGYVCKKRTNRRQGEEYIYYINPYFSSIDGFTMLENVLVKLMINELTDGEIKLYSYLCMMIGSSKNDCWASQKYLAKKIDKTQQGISLITNKLCDKKYINKKTIEKDGIKHCIYNLNY